MSRIVQQRMTNTTVMSLFEQALRITSVNSHEINLFSGEFPGKLEI